MFPRFPKAALLSTAAVMAVTAIALPNLAAAQSRITDPRALADNVDVRIVTPAGEPVEPTYRGELVDDSALRYYASVRDFNRVNAEIERLRQLNPLWEPPADLFDARGGPNSNIDESTLWRLYEEGDYEAVRSEISILQNLHPNWLPPEQLTQLLDSHEVRQFVLQAGAAADWTSIVERAAEQPEMFGCSDIESAWALANAQYQSNNIDEAYAVYDDLMDECEDVGLRLSTLQKALANRNNPRLARLVEDETTRPKSTDEVARFEKIKKDFEGKGGTYTPTEEEKLGVLIGRLAAGQVPASEVPGIGRQVVALRNANGAMVIGYHYANQDDWGNAKTWFERAVAWEPNAPAAEGLAYARLNTGDLDGAREVAEQWVSEVPALADVLDGLAQTELAQVFEQGDPGTVLKRLDELGASEEIDPSLELLRGWALTNLQRPTEAGQVFAAVLEDDRTPPALFADAAYGLALSRAARGNGVAARTLISRYNLDQEKRNAIEIAAMSQEAVAAFQRKDYVTAIATIERLEILAPIDTDLALLKGWSLFKQQRYDDAHALFTELRRTFNSAEAAEGQRASRIKRDEGRGFL